MNHGKHAYLMMGLVAVGAVLFLTGNVGGLLFLLWPVACMAMMVWMMWAMRGMGGSAPGPADQAPDDGLDARAPVADAASRGLPAGRAGTPRSTPEAP